MAPAVISSLAFVLYEDTSKAFHSFVQFASHNTFSPVDGGAYLTDMITPALNGPVASFISLLFGTLTSMTVGNLYNRQANMAQVLSDLLEDLRLAELHFQYFPTEYRTSAKELLNAYSRSLLKTITDDSLSPDSMKEKRELGRLVLEKLMTLLHDMAQDPAVQVNDRVMDEAYGTLNRIFQLRSKLLSLFENQFPVWHYGNLALLALAICTIFLVLTDMPALLFLGGFQLRMCWSMLIGTFTMLAVVLYDLNTPMSGAYQVSMYNGKNAKLSQSLSRVFVCLYQISKPIRIGGLEEYVDNLHNGGGQ
jgi:hypothetical protein